MSTVGYYRYKFSPTEETEVELYINAVLTTTKTVTLREWCTGMKRIKFLNKDGQYRFFNFNRFWESSDKPKELGRANKIVTSLLTSQSSENSVGYKNERTWLVMADDISQPELDILSDLWASPRVFLYVGDETTDDMTDWIQVSVKSNDNLNRIRKAGYVDIAMIITLPEWYSISML